MGEKVKATVAKAGRAQPDGDIALEDIPLVESSAVGGRLNEMLAELLTYAAQANLRPALDRLGAEFERQINEAKTNALEETRAEIENHFQSFQARLEIRALDVVAKTEKSLEQKSADSIAAISKSLEMQQAEAAQQFTDSIRIRVMQMVVNEEDRMRREVEELVTMEMAHFTEKIRNRGDEMSDKSITRFNKQLDEATTRVHQSFLRNLVSELSGKQANFLADAMKPLEEAAEQNLKRMRKELTRVVKEVGQRFVSGPDTED